MKVEPPRSQDIPTWIRRYWRLWSVIGLVVVALVIAWPVVAELVDRVFSFLGDEEKIEAFVIWLGWLGPPVLIAFNALQIVIAPVPAYAIFGAAGFLYGPIWGGIYCTLGTLLGATMAMLITRHFGRSWAERMVGDERLARWNRLSLNRNLVLWGLLLLAPIGDVPYFLAGLSRVRVWQILVLTLITRVPTIFLVTSAASSAVSIGRTELMALAVAVVVVFVLLLRYQAEILAWFEHRIQAHVGRDEFTLPQSQTSEREP